MFGRQQPRHLRCSNKVAMPIIHQRRFSSHGLACPAALPRVSRWRPEATAHRFRDGSKTSLDIAIGSDSASTPAPASAPVVPRRPSGKERGYTLGTLVKARAAFCRATGLPDEWELD